MISALGIYKITNKLTHKHQRGFTLLEVMLVVLLMGLTAASISFAIGGTDPKEKLTNKAQQFISTVELILDEVVLSGQFVGIVIDPDKYHFVAYIEEQWQPLTDDHLFAERQLPDGMTIELTLDGLPLIQEDELDESSLFDEPSSFDEEGSDFDPDKKKLPEPQILLLPSGEISAFELTFLLETSDDSEHSITVYGDSLGRLQLEPFDDFK